MTIKYKLYLGFCFILAIVLIEVASSWVSLKKLLEADGNNIHAYQMMHTGQALLTNIINIETGQRGFVITGKEEYLEPLQSDEKVFQDNLTMMKHLTTQNPKYQKLLADLEQLEKSWRENIIYPTIKLRRELNATSHIAPVQTLHQLFEQYHGKSKVDAMRTILRQIDEEETMTLKTQQAFLHDTERLAFLILEIGAVIATIASVLIARVVSQNIATRMEHAALVAEEISKGNFNIVVKQEGNDEIAVMLKSLATMQNHLSEMMKGIKKSANEVVKASNDIANATEEITNSSQEQSNAASSMAASVEQLTVSIGQVAENAQEAKSISVHSGDLSAQSGTVIEEAVLSIQKIAETVKQAAHEIENLEQESHRISSIVNVIKDIADQTNLLALNAAIEAARAGEQGRGFAVVADEVRKLAEKTTNSTEEIAQMIGNIQNNTHIAVSTMMNGVEQVNTGVDKAHQAGDSTREIRHSTQNVIDVVNNITTALKEQTQVSLDVANKVERIAMMAEENNTSVHHANDATKHLRELAHYLEQSVSQFQLKN